MGDQSIGPGLNRGLVHVEGAGKALVDLLQLQMGMLCGREGAPLAVSGRGSGFLGQRQRTGGDAHGGEVSADVPTAGHAVERNAVSNMSA